jgi:hypothetical protein
LDISLQLQQRHLGVIQLLQLLLPRLLRVHPLLL